MLQSPILPKLTIALALPLWCAAPAAADMRIARARSAIQVAQLYSQPPADVPGGGAYSGGGQDAAGLDVRVDRLEDQVRTLNGQIEQMQFDIRRLNDQLRKFQQDVDFRFRDNGRGGGPAVAPEPAEQHHSENDDGAAPAAAASLDRSAASFGAPGPGTRGHDAFDPSAHPNAPGAPLIMGTLPDGAGPQSAAGEPQVIPAPEAAGAAPLPQGPIVGDNRASGAPLELPSALNTGPTNNAAGAPSTAAGAPLGPAGAPSGPAGAPPAAPSPIAAQSQPQAGGTQFAALPTHTARDDFESAAAALKGQQFETAEIGFKRFVDKYPQNRLVPDAVFYLGESYFMRNRYREAAEQYLKISADYAKTAKAPESLLRLGQSLDKLGAKEQACAAFVEVGRKYPHASAGVRAAAEHEAKRVRC